MNILDQCREKLELATHDTYDIIELPKGTFILTRHDAPRGQPNNAEYQFWYQREELRAIMPILVERLEKAITALKFCRTHVNLDDPNWDRLSALAFASRCGLVDFEVRHALEELEAPIDAEKE